MLHNVTDCLWLLGGMGGKQQWAMINHYQASEHCPDEAEQICLVNSISCSNTNSLIQQWFY